MKGSISLRVMRLVILVQDFSQCLLIYMVRGDFARRTPSLAGGPVFVKAGNGDSSWLVDTWSPGEVLLLVDLPLGIEWLLDTGDRIVV